jgi:exopolysaccharide biosynthesis protein
MRKSLFPTPTLLALLLVLCLPGISQTIDLKSFQTTSPAKGILLYQINSDSIFGEKQQVVIAELQREALPLRQVSIAYSETLLKRTSTFAEEAGATVALNGGFFDVEKGGSVAYLEDAGKVVANTRLAKEKWGKTDSLLNGAIILDMSGSLKIELAKTVDYYAKSDHERAVMVAGPMLLLEGKFLPLEQSAFVTSRHPRSCLCETTDKSILFIAIDGRSRAAAGMTLVEAQKFLRALNCATAINLDGGGSTTLWVNDLVEKKIINHPSDKTGERPVANILLIK